MCTDLVSRIRASGRLVILMVFVGLFTDSLLLTLVDPILPDILRRIDNLTTSDTKLSSLEINNNGRYGYLVASKGATQFICNPFVGILVTKYGYRRPMLFSSIVLLGSTVAFAFGNSYMFLFGTRMLQGAASSVTAVTGMGLLAATFSDDHERGQVMGIAIGGLSLGIIVGPIYGSVLYQFFGQAVPFLALAAMVLFDISLQLFGFTVDKGTKDHSLRSMFTLMSDPYILIVAGVVICCALLSTHGIRFPNRGNVFLLNLDVSMILAFLPMRLMDLEDPETWKLGIVVLPSSIGYLIASIIFPRSVKYIKRWLCGFLGLLLSSITMAGLAFSYTFINMMIITTFSGIALGMVSTSMQPIFAQLVDLRHAAVYGNVYAISDMSVCAAMFIGPLVGGPILFKFGFEWMIVGVAVLNLCFAQFCFLLRNPPPKISKDTFDPDEKSKLISKEWLEKSTSSSTFSRSSRTSRSVRDIPVPRYLECLSGVEDFTPKDGHVFIDSV